MARVSIETDSHGFYKEMSEKGANRPALFKTMKDVFMFSFVIGVRNGIRQPLRDKTDVFDTDVFDRDADVPVLNGVYLAGTPELLALNVEKDERLSADVLKEAEEYANAGVQIVRQAYKSIEPERSLMMLLTVGP